VPVGGSQCTSALAAGEAVGDRASRESSREGLARRVVLQRRRRLHRGHDKGHAVRLVGIDFRQDGDAEVVLGLHDELPVCGAAHVEPGSPAPTGCDVASGDPLGGFGGAARQHVEELVLARRCLGRRSGVGRHLNRAILLGVGGLAGRNRIRGGGVDGEEAERGAGRDEPQAQDLLQHGKDLSCPRLSQREPIQT